MTEGITIKERRRGACSRCGREAVQSFASLTGWEHVELLGWCGSQWGRHDAEVPYE